MAVPDADVIVEMAEHSRWNVCVHVYSMDVAGGVGGESMVLEVKGHHERWDDEPQKDQDRKVHVRVVEEEGHQVAGVTSQAAANYDDTDEAVMT